MPFSLKYLSISHSRSSPSLLPLHRHPPARSGDVHRINAHAFGDTRFQPLIEWIDTPGRGDTRGASYDEKFLWLPGPGWVVETLMFVFWGGAYRKIDADVNHIEYTL